MNELTEVSKIVQSLSKMAEKSSFYNSCIQKKVSYIKDLMLKIEIEESKDTIMQYLMIPRSWYLEQIRKSQEVIRLLYKRYGNELNRL